MPEKLITVKEVAGLLGITELEVRELAELGEMQKTILDSISVDIVIRVSSTTNARTTRKVRNVISVLYLSSKTEKISLTSG